MATTHADDIEYAGAGPDVMRIFLDDLGKHPLLTADEQAALAKRVELGDESARNELFGRARGYAMRALEKYVKNRGDHDDIAQEAMIKVFVYLDGFRGDSRFKSWVYRIAINAAHNFYRDKKKDVLTDDGLDVAVDRRPGPEDRLRDAQLCDAALAFVASLPPIQGRALRLRLLTGATFTEIQATMGASCYDTAKANYWHGIIKLRRYMEELDGPPVFPL